jgi:hypothetical protein
MLVLIPNPLLAPDIALVFLPTEGRILSRFLFLSAESSLEAGSGRGCLLHLPRLNGLRGTLLNLT